MSEMVERVAKAIFELAEFGISWSDEKGKRKVARAAIEAHLGRHGRRGAAGTLGCIVSEGCQKMRPNRVPVVETC